MAFDIGASVSMMYQVIGIVLIFAGISLVLFILRKYLPGMGNKRGTVRGMALFGLLGLLGMGLFGSLAYVNVATATVGGSADNQEVITGGLVYVTWTGLTKDSVYSVTINDVTCSNFTAPGTSYSHTVNIPEDGANTIVLYNSTYASQKSLTVYGKALTGFIPEALINAIMVVIIGVVILLGIAGMIIATIKGLQMWG